LIFAEVAPIVVKYLLGILGKTTKGGHNEKDTTYRRTGQETEGDEGSAESFSSGFSCLSQNSQADYILRGVLLREGYHKVEFTYESFSFFTLDSSAAIVLC